MDWGYFTGEKQCPLISTSSPCCNVIGYAHLGIAVSDMTVSTIFYTKIGFSEIQEDSQVKVLRNNGGLELHLFQCDRGIEDDKNLLMDFPSNKFPGHTHAAITVPNVLATQSYLESQEISISGERKKGDRLLAVFARDPDRTTFEFEKNVGDPEDVEITGEVIGVPKGIDHVGIRVSNPSDRFMFYAEKLGFLQNVNTYEANPEPLKNFPPWISRTFTGCDINFIINANENPDENILLAGNCIRPGIVFVAFSVDNLDQAEENLKSAGVYVVKEEEIAMSRTLSCLHNRFLPSLNGKSLFLQDPDKNVVRLISN